MPDYEKMYHFLFNTMADALSQVQKFNLGMAIDRLGQAQRKCEEEYIKEGETEEEKEAAGE